MLKRESFVRDVIDWRPVETVSLDARHVQPPDSEMRQQIDELTLDGAVNRETYLTDREF